MIRVLVVDDSLFMRTVISDMLSRDPDIRVVGTASDGIEALRKIEEEKPDVITLDIEMPKLDGIGVLRKRSGIANFPRTLMLSSLTAEGAELTKTSISLGADDFMLKPRDITSVRGIERELIDKVKNLLAIPYTTARRETTDPDVAERVVLIGSSAGGPPMLDVVLSSLKAPLKAAVIITQHMPEGGFTAALAARLNRISPMAVKETVSGDILNSGQVYVSKAGVHTVITSFLSRKGKMGGKIIHSSAPPVHSVRPAVDKTFTSASHVYGRKIVSTILSGMGHDGGEGTREVKQHGGTTLVCREEDCLVYGMARTAIELGAVDRVIPLRRMADEISGVIQEMTTKE
ncbi:MAG: chemotaxis-specific protein-glutamate methyltransferase CheB [Methanomicrobiales archaeon]|nr:chemotaxis-specific protein-glutamate methyltransferase CheB [Methanomicrobiales archaeon]